MNKLNKTDIKMLSFIKDFKKLLKEYDIKGFYGDAYNNIRLITNDNEYNSYTINDELMLFKEHEKGGLYPDVCVEQLYKEYILNQFKNECNFKIENNTCAIITNNYDKALKVFNQILKKEIKNNNLNRYSLNNNNMFILTKNNNRYDRYFPSQQIKGLRYDKAWIDLDIDFNIMEDVIIPCGKYAERYNINFI